MRGRGISTAQVEKAIGKHVGRNQSQFVEWIPDNMMQSISDVNAGFVRNAYSGSMVANSTCIATPFNRILEQFDKMHSRKAFQHRYLMEGLDEMEYTESAQNVRDLVAEYLQYESMGVDSGSDDDDGEDMEAELTPVKKQQADETRSQASTAALSSTM